MRGIVLLIIIGLVFLFSYAWFQDHGKIPKKKKRHHTTRMNHQDLSDEYINGNETNDIDPPLPAPSNPDVPDTTFHITKEISVGVWSGVIRVDEQNKLWYYSKKKNNASPLYHKFSEIASYELYQDSDIIFKKGGTGRAVTGGLLFGAAGAIVGSNTAKRKTSTKIHEMYIRVSLKDISSDFVKIPLCGNTTTDSIVYKSSRQIADQILSLFDAMVSQAQTALDAEIYKQTSQTPSTPTPAIFSSADEIQKFKALLDCGAITKDEYETAKKRLLDF